MSRRAGLQRLDSRREPRALDGEEPQRAGPGTARVAESILVEIAGLIGLTGVPFQDGFESASSNGLRLQFTG
ncbi:MAG: hypothetical protein CMJ47_02050 [Planctomyces sp.]|nr:hypothetical protein [Planctomyces sp.]